MEKTNNNKGRIVQLRFTPAEVERLDSLKEKTLASTRSDVFRSALRMYEFFFEQLAKGYSIQLKKDNEVKTVIPL